MDLNHNFKVGEVVVCVNARRRWYNLNGLKKGELYTIIGFNPYDGGLILNEVKAKSGYNAYKATRFRKVDTVFAENILSNIEAEIKEDAKVKPFVPSTTKERIAALTKLN